MNKITKLSEITCEDVAEYLHLDDLTSDDINFLNNLLEISISYIMGYTGHTKEELDNYNDLIIVVMVLCQDMYDNRTMYIDTNNPNMVVQSILNMHSVNLLPSVGGD